MTATTIPLAPVGVRSADVATGSVQAVSVVSTGTTQIHPQQPSGSRIPMYAWIVGSR